MTDNENRDGGTSGRASRSSQETGSESSENPIDLAVLERDSVFSILDDRRRRYVLYALAEDPEWTLQELATRLVAWEEGVEDDDVGPHCRERRYISLYHTHLPKLADEDVVEFDADAERITSGERAAEVIEFLAAVE